MRRLWADDVKRRMAGLALVVVCVVAGLIDMTMEELLAPPAQVIVTPATIQTIPAEIPIDGWYFGILAVLTAVGLVCLIWPPRPRARADHSPSSFPYLMVCGPVGTTLGSFAGAVAGAAFVLYSTSGDGVHMVPAAAVTGVMTGAFPGLYLGLLIGLWVARRARLKGQQSLRCEATRAVTLGTGGSGYGEIK